MLQRTRGIVFRTIKFSESSVVSRIYTEKFGLQAYIINGVRSPKSKVKASLLQSLSLLEMEVYHRENRNLNRIKEFSPAVVFVSIPFDLLKGSVGLFMIEVLSKSIHEEEANEQLFHFIFDKIKSLDALERIHNGYLLEFLAELTIPLGLRPHGNYSEQTPEFNLREGSFVRNAPASPHSLDERLSKELSDLLHRKHSTYTAASRKLLLEVLLQYYQLHVPGFTRPKSLNVLEEVFRN